MPNTATGTPTVIDHAQRTLAHRQPGEARSATFDAISRATGYALDGQPDLVARHGHHAVDLATDGASQRAHDRLHTMAVLAAGNQHHDGVAAVLGRVHALLQLAPARR